MKLSISLPADVENIGATDLEELRLALVLNGGVSLAVWIGGVAAEINRLVRKQGLYGELLRATATEARVDVISGTSAGGINGALLALATVFDADLAALRDVWLHKGSIASMLRSPVNPDPPSLLLGNEYFFEELLEAFRSVRRAGHDDARPGHEAPIELTLTTTLLHGLPNTSTDDFGTVIADIDHRAQFVFRRGPGVEYDSFDDARIADRLAFAARATSSFPVAFEPRFYPADAPDSVGAPIERDTHNLKRSRYLLDGGILDNKPLESAIKAVFRQSAQRDVRRVLAYIVPNPGGAAASGIADDDKDDIPGISQVALASLMELPRVESISGQIRDVAEHNRKVRRKHQNRAGLMQLDAAILESLALSLYPVYLRRRLESSADYIMPLVADGIAAETQNQASLGRRLRGWLVERFLDLADEVPWVPQGNVDAALTLDPAEWRWGVFALENMVDLTLDVLKRSLRLTTPGPGDRELRQALMKLRGRTFELFGKIQGLRFAGPAFWRERGKALHGLLSSTGGGRALDGALADDWIRESLEAWRKHVAETGKAAEGSLYTYANELAAIIVESAQHFRQRHPANAGWGRDEDRGRHRLLQQHFDALVPAETNTADPPIEQVVLRNLLIVEIVLNAFGSYRDVVDQYVEMMQISADVATAFNGPAKVEKKLAGAQLANFGAFLKRSWRANDWMFGRLDGAAHLSRVLVNPDRLRRLYGTYCDRANAGGSAAVLDTIHALAVNGITERADRLFLEKEWRRELPDIRQELAYLDSNEIPVPEQLPRCALAVTRRLQLEILRDELPIIADAVGYDLQQGADPTSNGANFERGLRQAMMAAGGKLLSPDAIVENFRNCGIGEERIEDEVGSDLVTAVASRAAAVIVTAGAGKHSNLGPVKRLFAFGRAPAIGFNFLAENLVKQSRTGVALFTAALTIGATLLALDIVYVDEVPGWLWTAGVVLFVAAMAAAFMRRSGMALAVTAIAGVVLLVGTGSDLLQQAGVSGSWVGYVRGGAVAVFLLIVSALAGIVSRGPKRKTKRGHKRMQQPAGN